MRELLTGKGGDLFSGLVALAIGGFVIFEASGYPLGSLQEMGPGYFPVLLGVVMCLMGVLLIMLRRFEPVSSDVGLGSVRGALMLGAAFLAFALLVERVGLVPTAFVTTLLASQSDERITLKGSALLAAVTALASYLIFNLVLGIQIPAVKL